MPSIFDEVNFIPYITDPILTAKQPKEKLTPASTDDTIKHLKMNVSLLERQRATLLKEIDALRNELRNTTVSRNAFKDKVEELKNLLDERVEV